MHAKTVIVLAVIAFQFAAHAAGDQKPVAILFGKPVHDSDLEPDGPKSIQARIFSELRSDLAKRNKIAVSQHEIDQFNKRFAVAPAPKNEAERKAGDQFAEQMVRSWKIDKQLYEQYGGEVVFQQANPAEPVGAYRSFLREHEKKGTFKILDSKLRDEFWAYFERDGETTVSEADAKEFYEAPWWIHRRTPKETEAE